MNRKKVLVHASRALCAMIVFVSFLAGCEKKKEVETPPEKPHYMHDPELQAKLAAQDRKRGAIFGEREKLRQAFAALEKRAGSKEAAEKLPEYAELKARAEALGRTFESNRMETAEIMRAKMAPLMEAKRKELEARRKAKK